MAALKMFAKKDKKPATSKKTARVKKPVALATKKDVARDPMTMSLSQMLLLESPVVSEKSARIVADSAYVFRVRPDANKTEIKKVVEALYRVHVKKVNIVKIPPKEIHVRRVKGWRKGYKKAMVTLLRGETIEQV